MNRTDQPQNELLSIVKKLETKLNRQRRITSITFFLSSLLMLLFTAELFGIDIFRPKVIRAQAFVLQSPDGAVRSEWSFQKDETLFAMYDSIGTPQCAISTDPVSTGIHVYDERGIRRSVLGYRDNETSLMFMNSGGVYQSALIAKNNGMSEFQLRNQDPIPLLNMLQTQIN